MATEEASIGRGAVLHWPRPAEGDTSAVRTPSSAQQPTGAKEILSSLKRNIFSTLTPLKQHETSQRARNTAGDRENKKPQTAWKTLCHPLDRNTAGTCSEGKQAAAGTTWPHSTDCLQGTWQQAGRGLASPWSSLAPTSAGWGCLEPSNPQGSIRSKVVHGPT